MQQQTLSQVVKIDGIGLHSGLPSTLIISPAKENNGITFSRSDTKSSDTPALYSSVVDTKNCTCLADKEGNFISTIEHLMSALYISGIDNAHISRAVKVHNGGVGKSSSAKFKLNTF